MTRNPWHLYPWWQSRWIFRPSSCQNRIATLPGRQCGIDLPKLNFKLWPLFPQMLFVEKTLKIYFYFPLNTSNWSNSFLFCGTQDRLVLNMKTKKHSALFHAKKIQQIKQKSKKNEDKIWVKKRVCNEVIYSNNFAEKNFQLTSHRPIFESSSWRPTFDSLWTPHNFTNL